MSENPTAAGKGARARKAKAPAAVPTKRAWRRWIVPVFVVIVLVSAAIAWLVHANNVQSKVTHEEFASAQKTFEKADVSYKEAAQKLKNEAGSCMKSYSEYDVCPALTAAHENVEKVYSEVVRKVDAIDPKAVDRMPEATQTYKEETSRLQDLERKAASAVEDYSAALLKAVRDEHSTAMNDARTQLKEAKALLSNSEGRTSDEDLWEAVKKMLSVHGKVLAEQEEVDSSDPDAVIEATKVVRTETAAIESEMSHLKAVYDAKGTSSPGESESADSEAKESRKADGKAEASKNASSASPSAEATDGAGEGDGKATPAAEEGMAEDPDA